MTEENFKYRTNPLFLRNEFDSKEEWAMPVIPKPQSDITINSDLRLIGFDRTKPVKTIITTGLFTSFYMITNLKTYGTIRKNILKH